MKHEDFFGNAKWLEAEDVARILFERGEAELAFKLLTSKGKYSLGKNEILLPL